MTMTVTEVRDELLAVFEGLLNHTIDPKEAYEINQTAGKVIASAKAQLVYHALRRERPEIPFLDSEPVTQTIAKTHRIHATK